uniref:Uncharacterized protein n=1 Tax=Lepeophtheirus salmonis TaxID=72036 RepID=A0A0K2UCS6_LEPSM
MNGLLHDCWDHQYSREGRLGIVLVHEGPRRWLRGLYNIVSFLSKNMWSPFLARLKTV